MANAEIIRYSERFCEMCEDVAEGISTNPDEIVRRLDEDSTVRDFLVIILTMYIEKFFDEDVLNRKLTSINDEGELAGIFAVLEDPELIEFYERAN